MTTARVLVVGDAGVDVLVRHAGPIVPGDDSPALIRTALGGAGANTATWLAHLGVDTTLVGRIGDDPAGRQVLGGLTTAGVRAAMAVDPDVATCCVVVLVAPNGQRTMLPDRGAAGRLHPDDLDPTLLAGAAHLHLSGYVLLQESTRAAGLATLAAARAAGLRTSVDPQSAALIGDRDAFLAAVRGVDLLLPNADELAALTGSTDPASAARLLDVVGAVAVTSGVDGAAWVDHHGLIAVPATNTACVDSTGAGDAFNAGVIAALLTSSSTVDAVRAGVAAGAAAIGVEGGQPPSITG